MPFHYDKDEFRKKIKDLNCCVIIPTYNNGQTLGKVITDVLDFTPNAIVINDGSTDGTGELLKTFPGIEVIAYSLNKGKGYALRQGLKRAEQNSFRYAISIDSDGQHFANDIPLFIHKIEEAPDSMLIGARNLRQDNMPRKNTFGNKLSNFWFHFQTNISLPDTQSGYRLYPVDKIKGTTYFTTKYEFEIEVMVKAAWKGVNIEPVPIHVYYAEVGERVSHFRPGNDFFRISLLNTYLTILALIWYKPKHFFKNFTRKNIRTFLSKNFLNAEESIMRKSVGMAFGVFMGIIPIWGYQFVAALILAHFMKLNKAIVGLAAQISVPPLIPFLLYGSLKTGQFMLGRDLSDNIFNSTLTVEKMKQHLLEYILGSVLFAVLMGALIGLVSFIVLRIIGKKVLVKAE